MKNEGIHNDLIQSQAEPSMVKSGVVDSATGKRVDSNGRTSTGTFLTKAQDSIIENIERRVAQVTMIPQGELYMVSRGTPHCFPINDFLVLKCLDLLNLRESRTTSGSALQEWAEV